MVMLGARGGFSVGLEPDLGGRWSSLVDPHGREWLWSRPDPARALVVPGQAFVDVGGLEECLPTIGANPDHGELWTRPWATTAVSERSYASRIEWNGWMLDRRIEASTEAVVADYRLTAPPGSRFIWAAHALLELPIGARIEARAGRARAWPGHVGPVETTWPHPLGIDYAHLPADDGSAMFCLLPGQDSATARDDAGSLRLAVHSPGQPASIGLWRNLGGYPWGDSVKYRNIAIEPMLGTVFDLDQAQEGETAVVPPSGEVEWRLTISNG
jgi:hypothetical protein